MNFHELAFTADVRALQERFGSRGSYAKASARRGADLLGPAERDFLSARDGVFLATVTSDGWPYVQFRGGPPGFLHVLDERHIAFADVRGNRQYITTGNLAANDRVAIIALDFAQRERLKLMAHAEIVEPGADPELDAAVAAPRADGVVERIVRLTVAGFDWNCPQHITPRFSLDELRAAGIVGA
jgi:hypothetical protein